MAPPLLIKNIYSSFSAVSSDGISGVLIDSSFPVVSSGSEEGFMLGEGFKEGFTEWEGDGFTEGFVDGFVEAGAEGLLLGFFEAEGDDEAPEELPCEEFPEEGFLLDVISDELLLLCVVCVSEEAEDDGIVLCEGVTAEEF